MRCTFISLRTLQAKMTSPIHNGTSEALNLNDNVVDFDGFLLQNLIIYLGFPAREMRKSFLWRNFPIENQQFRQLKH